VHIYTIHTHKHLLKTTFLQHDMFLRAKSVSRDMCTFPSIA